MTTEVPRTPVRAATALALLCAAAAAMLIAGGGPSPIETIGPSAQLTAQLGVSSAIALKIVKALNSPWALALSLLLVPLGLGASALTIRAVFATFVATIGKKAAQKAMVAW